MTFSFDNQPTSIIPEVLIDPQNEEDLATAALVDAYTESLGELNDTSDHNPLAVFTKTLARLGSEILWYANKLPRALAVAYLKLTQVERSLGSKARVTIQFTLAGAVTSAYTIPIGFEIKPNATLTNAEDLSFILIEPLIITPGNSVGFAMAECSVIGKIGNVPENTLTQFFIPYASLSEITNPEKGYGGDDLETLDHVEFRALTQLRTRDSLIVKSDYEQAAESLMGANSRAIAISQLGGDGDSYQLGAVHIFGVKEDLQLPSLSEISDYMSILQDRIPLGTAVYFSPIVLVEINLHVICQILDGYDPNAVMLSMLESLKMFLDPVNYFQENYLNLKDLEYNLRNVTGVKRVNSVTINNQGLDLYFEHKNMLPKLNSLYIESQNSENIFFEFAYGEGDLE